MPTLTPTKKLSYSDIILKVLEDEPDRKFETWELMKVRTKYGWIGTSGDVRARELARLKMVNKNEDHETPQKFWHKAEEPQTLKLI